MYIELFKCELKCHASSLTTLSSVIIVKSMNFALSRSNRRKISLRKFYRFFTIHVKYTYKVSLQIHNFVFKLNDISPLTC